MRGHFIVETTKLTAAFLKDRKNSQRQSVSFLVVLFFNVEANNGSLMFNNELVEVTAGFLQQFSIECLKTKNQTQTIKRTNQNSKQIDVAGVKRGKTHPNTFVIGFGFTSD